MDCLSALTSVDGSSAASISSVEISRIARLSYPRFQLIDVVRVGAHPVRTRQTLAGDNRAIADQAGQIVERGATKVFVRGARGFEV